MKVGSGVNVNVPGQELHKPVFNKFNKRKVYLRFKDSIFAAHLAEIRSLSCSNLVLNYLLCVLDVSTKYSGVNPLTDKKGKTILHGFFKIIKESTHKPNKLWLY